MFCRCFFGLFVLYSFGHCIVCLSSVYGFWLPLWYLQAFPCLARNHKRPLLTSYWALGAFRNSELLALGKSSFTFKERDTLPGTFYTRWSHRPAHLADAFLEGCYPQRRHYALILILLYWFRIDLVIYLIMYVIKILIFGTIVVAISPYHHKTGIITSPYNNLFSP